MMTNCNDGSEERRAQLITVPDGGLWTAKQVAAFLRTKPGWVYEQVRENKGIPFVRLGDRNYRFDPARIRAWVASRSVQGQEG